MKVSSVDRNYIQEKAAYGIPYQRWRLVKLIYYYYSIVYFQYTNTHTHTDILSEIPITRVPTLLYPLTTEHAWI